MGFWRYGSCITIDGDAYIDFNTEVRDRSEDIIKLFTDEELKEEIEKRENARSKYENRIDKLHTYIYNVEVDVDSQDVLNEVDNDDLIEEVQLRNLNINDSINVEKHELRKIICRTLDINEMYEDEEIFEMLKETWRHRR
jgi:hypothetical protein